MFEKNNCFRYIFHLFLISLLAACSPCPPKKETALFYRLPADVNDFPNSREKHEEMKLRWNRTISASTMIGIAGEPLQLSDKGPALNYLNPKSTVGQNTLIQPITWTTFPNRIAWYFKESQGNPYQIPQWFLYPLADEGRLLPDTPGMKAWLSFLENENLTNFKDPKGKLHHILDKHPALASTDTNNFAPVSIPTDLCPVVNWRQEKSEWSYFDAAVQGPRGWKDEYNEWVVTRDENGKITKVSFTSENPEYWFTLWSVDRNRVVELYRELVNASVKEEDLYLRDKHGNTVKDHFGHPVYNPLNKWNFGVVATNEKGGAVHLTSPPNTVGAEIGIGAASTILRDLAAPEYSPANNICAGLFGNNFRNSDPNIGMQVSQIVRNAKLPLTLQNPVALYMQVPDFSNYQTPDNSDPREFFKILRGKTSSEAGTKYDQVLHAVFEVPKEKGYTVSDIKIGGIPIYWASQMSETINVALAGEAYPELAVPVSAKLPKAKNLYPQNGQSAFLVEMSVLQALNDNSSISSATLPVLPFEAKKGSYLKNIALIINFTQGQTIDLKPTIYFTRPDGTIEANIKVTLNLENPLPQFNQAQNYLLDIDIPKHISTGIYGLQVATNKGAFWAPSPGMLVVID